MNRLFPWGMDLGNINNRILYVPILGHEAYRHIVPVCFYRIGDSSYSIKTLREDRTPAEWKMLLAATRRRRRISLCEILCSSRIGNSSYSIQRSARFFVPLWEDKTVEVEVWNF